MSLLRSIQIQQLFIVHGKDKKTGEKVAFRLWATNCDNATRRAIKGGVIGTFSEYQWTGTEPAHDGNEIITRAVEVDEYGTEMKYANTEEADKQ